MDSKRSYNVYESGGSFPKTDKITLRCHEGQLRLSFRLQVYNRLLALQTSKQSLKALELYWRPTSGRLGLWCIDIYFFPILLLHA